MNMKTKAVVFISMLAPDVLYNSLQTIRRG